VREESRKEEGEGKKQKIKEEWKERKKEKEKRGKFSNLEISLKQIKDSL
jgi:hypothetical protein